MTAARTSPPVSGTVRPPKQTPRPSGAARAIRWMLGVQIVLAGLLAAGGLLQITPQLLPRTQSAPDLRTPIDPGDQVRRYSPHLDPADAPSGPGFPGRGAVPARLSWESRSLDGTPALFLTGQIQTGDAARFLAHLDGLDAPPATVTLHSPGGSVADALEIGRRLRADGIATRMQPGAACFSACPYILAGGIERRVSRTAMVGVHQHYFGQSTILPAFLAVKDIQRGQADVMAYLDEMGIDLRLMERAMKTAPEDIYILVEDELTSLGIATEVTD
jgi:hypothetical protein